VFGVPSPRTKGGEQVRAHVERSALVANAPAEAVDFAVAGTDAAGEFRCTGCGYGAAVQRVVPACPMCAGTVRESHLPTGLRPVG
jgi:hypothetical protein